MRTISKDIQSVFEELIKLLLRKSLRPALNPLGNNTKIVYNTYRGRYERGLIGSSSDDNINKYNYTMTHESLGWADEVLANFKATAKFMKNSTVAARVPAGSTLHNSKCKSKIAFSDKEIHHAKLGVPPHAQYRNFLTFLTSRNMQCVIANKNSALTYSSDIPYTHTFRHFENIGRDIIDQTDPSISGSDSAKMSTSMLRVRLYNLERELGNLSVNHPSIYDAYIEMLRIINSVPRSKMVWLINLIASLTYQRWDNLPPTQQLSYVDALSEEFIEAFNSNEIITILLQAHTPELILTTAYLYPLLKMLFIVFGYSRIIPLVSDKTSEHDRAACIDRLKKHMERYRGATFRRGDSHPYDPRNDETDTDTSSQYNQLVSDRSTENIYNEMLTGQPAKPEPEPIDQCIYEFIKLYGDLYPTIIGLLGGTEIFPPESMEISCDDIPPNYNGLTSLPEYLWRFNDYSYCRYLEYVNSRQLNNNMLCSKIVEKAKYLHSI